MTTFTDGHLDAVRLLLATRPRKAWSLREAWHEAAHRWDTARKESAPHPPGGPLPGQMAMFGGSDGGGDPGAGR